MSDLYTDGHMQVARQALIEHCVDSANQADPEGAIRAFAESLYDENDPTVRIVLDAVAPMIAARALRDFADSTSTGDYGYGEQGSGWYERDAESVLDEARSRADDIDGGAK